MRRYRWSQGRWGGNDRDLRGGGHKRSKRDGHRRRHTGEHRRSQTGGGGNEGSGKRWTQEKTDN